jgi:predicted AAA+ superfamily ATPase
MEKYLIRQVLLEQKEEIDRILSGKIIERAVEPTARKLLTSSLIKVIMGVRRCGKSVLAHQLLRGKNYGYINFDDERFIGAKALDLNVFFEAIKEINPDFKYLLLDEIQNVEGWELFVNRLKRSGYNIIITGSNSKLLSKELATHLTGRHFSIHLYPFSFREFIEFKGLQLKRDDFYLTEKRAAIIRLFNTYMESGGFPEALKIEANGVYLRELFDKIITRDIISRYGIKYGRALKEIALFAVSNFGSRITYNKIRDVFQVKSVHTVKNYLNYLEEAYLLFQLNPFSFKIKEQIREPRKIYSIDTGLINAIAPKVTTDYGKLLENLVFLELKRRNSEVYFYHRPDYEVDFVIKNGLKIGQLIQVCYSLANSDAQKREKKPLLKASEELRCNELIIITLDEEKEEKTKGKIIKITPVWKWLLIGTHSSCLAK